MILRLGDYTGPTPIYDYSGTLVDPNVAATAAQCLPFQCGAQLSNIAARLWCAFWGQASARSACTDPACSPYKPSYCAPAPAAAPVQQTVQAAAAPTSTTTTTAPAAGGGGGATQTVVETPGGPVTMPAVLLPAVSDVNLTPMMVRIPNIWDMLDPSKISQFSYRGISTSFPVWISEQYRESLAPAESPEMLGPGGIPWWVLLLIASGMYMFSGHVQRRRVRRKAVAHGK